MAIILTDEQQVRLSVAFTTAAGNPARVDGVPAWESSDPSVIEIVDVAADGMSCTARTVGPLGSVQVSVKADADLGAGVREVAAVDTIEVMAAEAVSASISAGPPEVKV